MEAKFFGLVQRDVMASAYQLVIKNYVSHNFSTIRKSAGLDWLRHSELSFSRRTGIYSARVNGFNKEKVEKNFPPNNILNVDKTDISVVPS